MSETKGNEHIRKAPFERPTAADLLASSNRQRVDDEAHLPHVGEPESENAMAGDLGTMQNLISHFLLKNTVCLRVSESEMYQLFPHSSLDDAEWLNMALENILKMTDGQEESHQGDDDVNDLLTSSLDDNQNSASIPANPLDLPYSENNIFQQPMPHDELPDSFKPVIHYELNGTLNNQPEEQPLPDITDDIGEPEEQPLSDMADDFDEPEEQPLPDMTDDFDEPEEQPLPDIADDFDEPEEEPLPDIADDFDEPEEQPLPDIADDFDEPEEQPLPDNSTSPKDTTDKSVDNTKSNDAKQDISGTFEQSTVSVSDGFSPPSLETSGILDGKSKSNEVSDKMENNSNLSKTSKKSVKTKKTDVSRASQKISKTHADLQNTNSSTIVVNLRDILGYIFKNILIVILTALMCSMIGYIFTQKFVKHKYVSNTKLIIFTAEANNESQPSWDDLQLSFTLLTDCSLIVKSRDVLEDVIQELDLSISYSELLEKIDVSFMSNSRIIEISVTDEDPLQAMIIVKKLREVSMRYITDNLEVSGSKIIQKENIPHNPMPSYTRYYVMFGAIIGILVSSLVLAGIYIFQLENEFLKKQQKANA